MQAIAKKQKYNRTNWSTRTDRSGRLFFLTASRLFQLRFLSNLDGTFIGSPDLVSTREDHESIARQVGASNLRALRTSTGLSQAKFAAAVGLSERTLRRYESGERELPQATRLAIIHAFKIDPLASVQLAAELGIDIPDLSPAVKAQTAKRENFWVELRQEGRNFRAQNYSPLGQLFLKARDYAFLGATMYFAVKQIALASGIPFGVEINGIDWVLLGSFLVIALLFSSVIAELPVLKVSKHLLLYVNGYKPT